MGRGRLCEKESICLGAMDILKRVSGETAPPKSIEATNPEVKSKFFLDSVLSKTENAAIVIPVNTEPGKCSCNVQLPKKKICPFIWLLEWK